MTTKKCKLSIVSINGVSLEKYMKENSSKIKDEEEIKQLEKMFRSKKSKSNLIKN